MLAVCRAVPALLSTVGNSTKTTWTDGSPEELGNLIWQLIIFLIYLPATEVLSECPT